MEEIRLERLAGSSSSEVVEHGSAGGAFRRPSVAENPFRDPDPPENPFQDQPGPEPLARASKDKRRKDDLEHQAAEPETLGKNSWLSLFFFVEKKHRGMLAVAIFFSFASGLVIPGMSILLGKIFGYFAQYGSGLIDSETLVKRVTTYIFALVGLGCASWFLNASFVAGWIFFGELQSKSIKERLLDGLLKKDMEWYETQKSGVAALISKCQTQIYELQLSLSQPMGYIAQATVTATASLAVAFYHSWSLTLVILAGVPVLFLLLAIFSGWVQPHIVRQKEHLSDSSRIASRTMTSIETVKAFCGQEHERTLFAKAIDLAARDYLSQAKINALIVGTIRLFTISMFVQGFYYGSQLVRKGGSSKAADLITTFWSCSLATQSVQMVMPHLMVLHKGRAAGAALFDMLVRMEKGRTVKVMRGGARPTKFHGEVEMSAISFSYPSRPGQLALENAQFFFPANETTYVVGRSGSGKSTLGSLLVRTYEPLSGTISIDGHPIETLHPDWLQENVSLLHQQSVLFNETLFRNIAFGRRDHENVTRHEVLEACRQTSLEQTVELLPSGLETMVGEGGSQLSGGQRQRAAIARDRLRNANLLIIDEATSALDYITRLSVVEAVHEWRRGKTTIIITHDIKEIRPGDFVYVLEQGRIVQDGYRRDLERKPGAFRSFVDASHDTDQQSVCSGDQSIMIQVEVPSDSSDSDYEEPRSRPLSFHGARPLSMSEMASFGDQIMELPTIRTKDRPLGLDISERDLAAVTQNGAAWPFSPPRVYNQPKSPKVIDMVTPVLRKTRRSQLAKGIKRRLPRRKSKREISSLKILATVWPTLDRKRRGLFVGGFIAASFHAAATPIFSYALAKLLACILNVHTPSAQILKWAMIILGIAVSDAINCYLMHYLLESCGQTWVDHMRVQSLTRILEQPREWFDREKNAVHRVTEDLEKNAEEMRNLLGRFAGYTYVGLFMVILGIIWSLATSWAITLVGLTLAPFMYAISKGLKWVSDKYENRCNEASDTTGAILKETITNIKTVRNYALQGYFRAKYARSTAAGLRIGMRRAMFAGIGSGLSDSAILFATAIVFYFSVVLIHQGKADLNSVLIVSTLLLFTLSSANSVISLIPQVSNCKDTACRVLRLANLPLDSHEKTGQQRIATTTGAITFHAVNFSYPSRPDTRILAEFSMNVRAGECIAIVGPSGSGKSTVATLLQCLYPPSSGVIALDGVSLAALDVGCLRRQMAVVSQTPVLFDCSIAENIAYGLGHVEAGAVEDAARQAGIHEFVAGLPRGYDTVLGDAGSGLSGGQAQRIAIARALVRRPRLLVLDECTSSLDTESARLIRETVAGLVGSKRGMTVVIITHSVDMMRCAQRIVVMTEGRVVEVGTFDALLRKDGELARLLSMSSGSTAAGAL